MSQLEGKVAFLSGAARGIGAATAKRMAAAGAKVVIGDLLDDVGLATVAAIEAAGGRALYVHHDVTSEESWRGAVDAAVGLFGRLDILVNNAGLFLGKGSEEATLSDWLRICSVNLTGVVLGTRLALPALRTSARSSAQGSSIVNLSSMAGIVGAGLDPLYSLTKGGVALFTKSTALEFAQKKYRIRVNSIHPGVIETDMGDQVFAAGAKAAASDDLAAVRGFMQQSHPLGRLGTASDVAAGIVFLASDDSGFMTGSGLVVDGGFTAG